MKAMNGELSSHCRIVAGVSSAKEAPNSLHAGNPPAPRRHLKRRARSGNREILFDCGRKATVQARPAA
jgi:hypothetical protein